jgi:hypothetical protein
MAMAQTRITGNTSHDCYSLFCHVTAHHRKHMLRDPHTLRMCCVATVHVQAQRKHFRCIVAWRVLPRNGFTCHTILKKFYISNFLLVSLITVHSKALLLSAYSFSVQF